MLSGKKPNWPLNICCTGRFRRLDDLSLLWRAGSTGDSQFIWSAGEHSRSASFGHHQKRSTKEDAWFPMLTLNP